MSECLRSAEDTANLSTSSEVPKFHQTPSSWKLTPLEMAQRQEDGSVRPIAFASRTLQKQENNYGIAELEGLGVVWAANHFRPYLYGHPCTVSTDHQALKSLLNTPQPSGKLVRWGMALQELNLTIQHRSGKHNYNADALSRYPLPDSDSAGENIDNRLVAVLTAVERGAEPSADGEEPLSSLMQS